MKIGDKVRFLSETGGGRVVGFKGKNIVLVEDEDGFEIPTAANDVVVVDNDNYDTSRIVESKRKNPSPVTHESISSKEGMSVRAVAHASTASHVEERKGGDQLSAFIAFVPVDIHEITHTRFETYVVNDSNYYLHFFILTAEGACWTLRHEGEVEPNTKLFLEEFGRESLNEMERIAVQLIAFKREKTFQLKPSVDVQIRIDPVKFYKLHTFRENIFFEQPALLHTIIDNDQPARPLVIDAKQLKEQLYASKSPISHPTSSGENSSYVRRYEQNGSQKSGNPFINRKKNKNQPVVIDLHAHQLLDTTAGMTNSDILNYQLKVFHDTLQDYAQDKGTNIVFIHGKGEGVLRQAIIHELNYRYKQYPHQDASFQEYGYGATQVTIK